MDKSKESKLKSDLEIVEMRARKAHNDKDRVHARALRILAKEMGNQVEKNDLKQIEDILESLREEFNFNTDSKSK
jgi:hypothetical protein